MGPTVSYIDVEDPGQRIDNWLHRLLKAVPRARIYRMLRRGEVRVNGGRVKPTYRLRAGDRVRVPPVRTGHRPAPPTHDQALGRLLGEAVLFEDDGLLILDKPAGLAVHGGSGVSLGLIEALRGARSERFLELAHRLDRATSGCLIVAKSRAALGRVHALQRAGQVRKTYELLVAGRWPRHLNAVDLPLHRYLTPGGERRVRVAAHGKPSRTTFHRVRVAEGVTWLQARLHTGRTHQIRVHTASSGHPVLGDGRYGNAASTACSGAGGVRRLCLHASQLSFDWGNTRLRVQSPQPALFARAWARLSGPRGDDYLEN